MKEPLYPTKDRTMTALNDTIDMLVVNKTTQAKTLELIELLTYNISNYQLDTNTQLKELEDKYNKLKRKQFWNNALHTIAIILIASSLIWG